MSTPYDQRQAKEAASRAKLTDVVLAGAALGYWTLVKTQEADDRASWRWVSVVTPEGHFFQLIGGSWGRESAITCSIGTIEGPHGLRTSAQDVSRHGEDRPEASCSYTRPAETIAKDFYRRVIDTDKAREVCQRMAERQATIERQHADLRAHVAVLVAQGFECPRLGDQEVYRADLWMRSDVAGLRKVTVNCTGSVSFDADVSLAAFVEVLAVLKRAQQ